jgi:hypothetical protein
MNQAYCKHQSILQAFQASSPCAASADSYILNSIFTLVLETASKV